MHEFKIGDKVQLISSGKIGWEPQDYVADDELVVGRIYTVISVSSEGNIMVREGRMGLYINPKHFVLANAVDIVSVFRNRFLELK